MNKATATAKILAGERIFVCEYRSSKCENITWRDKDTGRSQSAHIVRHTLESGPDSLILNERTGDNFDASKWAAPAKKGQTVVVHVTELKTERGMLSARGTLEVLES